MNKMAGIADASPRYNREKLDTDYYVGRLRIPKYRSAMAQVVMVGLIAFCTV